MVALLLAAVIGIATPQELTIPVSDGTNLACALVEPDGAAPTGGWPGVILFHGLRQSHTDMEPIATQFLASAGYASLMCDARGTGSSGGQWSLDGPLDVQDARDLFNWFAARPEISDTNIGALGISLGGGIVWNAAAAGVPFKAIVPIITWSDLASALAPNGLSKSALVELLALAVPQSRWEPDLVAAEPALLASKDLTSFDALAAARSPVSKLASITTPTLLIQGRHDFLFDLDQALAAYKQLTGPKALYLGDLGHPPATNPPAELLTIYGEAIAWFNQYLKGTATQIPSVTIAHDPWDGNPSTFTGLPATKTTSVSLPGTTTLSFGSVVRGARLTGGPHETFGDGTVTVHYANAKNWDHLVAVVKVQGSSTPITEGGVRIAKATGVATIHLLDEAVVIPAGKRVTVAIGATSDVYATPVSSGAKITIGRETLTLSVLQKAVSP